MTAQTLPPPPDGCHWEIRRHTLNTDYSDLFLKKGWRTVAAEAFFHGAWGDDHYRNAAAAAARSIFRHLETEQLARAMEAGR